MVAIVIALAMGAGIGVYRWRERPAPVRYITAVVGRGAITRTVSATGTVNPVLTIIVGSYVSGVIQKLYCDFNTQVKVGQVCATIDPRPYRVVVDQARAALATAQAQLSKDQANLAYVKLNHGRLAWLLQRNSTSQDAVDNAKSALDQAQAQIAVDQAGIQQRAADLQAAEVNLSYTNITSPVNGTVVARNVTQGQTVAASFQTPTLFLIATDLTAMQIDASISESDIGQIRLGQPVHFSVEAYPNRQFSGQVVQIRQAPQTVQNVVTYDVVIGVHNEDRQLLPGMTATVRIVTAQRSDVLRVPDPALRYVPSTALTGASAPSSPASPGRAPASAAGVATGAPGQPRAWILREGVPQPISVQTGLDDDSYTEILGGLTAGQRIIVGEAGAGSSSPGRPVRFGL
jgi:HlyD family secretion protein